MLGNGDGTFQAAINFAVGKEPEAVVIADVNGDGKPDLVVGDAYIPNVNVLLGITGTATTHFSATGFANPVTSGVASSLTVTALDAGNAIDTSYTGTVTFTSSDPAFAGAPVSYTFTPADGGVHVFTGLSLSTVGTQSITVTDAGNSLTGSQTNIAVNTPATHLAVAYPATTLSGQNQLLTIKALNAANTTDTFYVGTVHITSSDPSFSPTNYTFQLTDNGVHTFNVALNRYDLSPESITATDTNTGTITGTQSGIVVKTATTQLAVSYPASTQSGQNQSLTITALNAVSAADPFYVGTVHFSSSDLGFTLGNYTFTAADAGTHIFTNVKLFTAGNQSITTTDTATATITGTDPTIAVTTATTHFTVTGFPASTASGAPHSLTVTALTVTNAVDTFYNGTISFTSTNLNFAGAPANYSFVPGSDHGVHVFNNVSLGAPASPPTYAITARDIVVPGITGSQAGITVTLAANSFTVTGFPTPSPSGTTATITVTAMNGAVADTAYTGTVTFTSSDPLATLPAPYTFVPATDNGVHTFSVTLRSAGTQSITAGDATNGFNGSQSGIVITTNAVAFVVIGYPNPTTAGAPHALTLRAVDGSGVTDANYGGTIALTSSDPQAAGLVTYTFVPGIDHGLHTFNNVVLKTAGTQSISATDTGNFTISGSRTGITVNPGAAASLIVATPIPATVTAGIGQSLKITAKDSFGNVATGYNGTVNVTSSDGAATGTGFYTFVPGTDKGSHTFAITLKTLGSQSVSVGDIAKPALKVSQTGIVVLPGAATQFSISAITPNPETAGTFVTFTVTAKDSLGNVATSYAGTVHFTSSDTQTGTRGGLPGDYQFNVTDAGVHQFTAKLWTAGTQTIRVTDVATNFFNSGAVLVVADPTTAKLSITGATTIQAGNSVPSFVVTAQDSYGNLTNGYRGAVVFSSSDPLASFSPASYTFVAADNGAHVFTNVATLRTAGAQSITATDSVTATITGKQTGIVVTAAAATALKVTNATAANNGFATTNAAGQAHNFVVSMFDTFGNVATGYTGTVKFASSDAQAILPANFAFTASDAGVHTFSATLRTAGVQSLTATDLLTPSITGSLTGLVVIAGTTSLFTLSGFPTPNQAGTAGSFTVRAFDAFGNPNLLYTGTVHFSSGDPLAVLPADYRFTGADQGKHVFQAILKTAATQFIGVEDTILVSTFGFQNLIAITAGPVAKLALGNLPSTVQAGNPMFFLVSAVDQFGNLAGSYTGTVALTSTDPQALLSPNYTFVPGDHGQHSFSGNLLTAGTQKITATDTATATITGSQTITVTPGPAATITLSAFPNPTVAGTGGTVTATLRDSFGNIATGYTRTINFSSSDTQATLPVPYAFTPGDAGVHAFGIKLNTVGTQSITLSDAVFPAFISASQSGIIVTPGAATRFTVTGYPSPITAGTAGGFTVTALDQFSNVATGYVRTVKFSSTDAQASLTGNYTFLASDHGVHVFPASTIFRTASATGQSLIATDTLSGIITGKQTGIVVLSTGLVSKLAVTSFPATATAGVAGSYRVTAQDTFGNTVTGYTGTVAFTSTDPLATFSPSTSYTFTGSGAGNDNGTHVFAGGATLRTAGAQNITATDQANAAITGAQTVTVVANAATAMTVAGFPSPKVAGTVGLVTVKLLDTFGNTATGYTGTVQLTSSDAQATLPAAYTFTGADAGAHAFSVTLKTAGPQRITATDIVNTGINNTQTGITVTPAAAATFSILPSGTTQTAGAAFNFTAIAVDAFGNLATNYAGTVTFTTSDASTSIVKQLPLNYTYTPLDAGVHIFSATLVSSGTQTIRTTDITTGATGSRGFFIVTNGIVKNFLVSGATTPTVAGTPDAFMVTARDSFNNKVAGYAGTVFFTTTDPGVAVVLPASYTFTGAGVGLDNGMHVFSPGITLVTAGAQRIIANDTTLAPGTTLTGSQTVTVTATNAVSMTFTGLSTTTTAGTTKTGTVSLLDQFGNVATGYRGQVTLVSSDPLAVLPADYVYTALDNGKHVFSFSLRKVGAQTITALDVATVTISAVGSEVVVPAQANHFRVTGFPNTAAGVTQFVTVTALDPFDNSAPGYVGTIHFSSSDPQAVLPPNTTFTLADSGQKIFAATLKTAGTQSLGVQDTAILTETGAQTGIVISGTGVTAKFKVSGFPSPQNAGTAGTFTVTAQDVFGNLAAGYTGTVSFTTSAASATFANGSYTFVAGDNGVHVFTNGATLFTAGTKAISATDAGIAATGSQTVTIRAGSAVSMLAGGFPSLVKADVKGSFLVQLFDNWGNIATGFLGSVTLTTSNATPVNFPSPSYTFTATDAGQHTFSLGLGTVSLASSITATSGTMSASQAGIIVQPGAIASFTATGLTNALAGTAQTINVTAKDAFGNVKTDYVGTIHFATSSPLFTLPGNYTFVVADLGAHSFTGAVKLNTAGTQSVTINDVAVTLAKGSQTGLVITPSVATTLTVSGFPTTATAGVSKSFTVIAKDVFGNQATGYTGTVQFGTNADPSSVTLPANYTFTAVDAGKHVFSATFTTAESGRIIQAVDSVNGINGTQGGITVIPAAIASFVVNATSPRRGNGAVSVVVAAVDAFANQVTGYLGTVHFTSSDPGAVLPADYTFTAIDAGQHAFSAKLVTAGPQTITVTDVVTATITGTSNSIAMATPLNKIFEDVGATDDADGAAIRQLLEAPQTADTVVGMLYESTDSLTPLLTAVAQGMNSQFAAERSAVEAATALFGLAMARGARATTPWLEERKKIAARARRPVDKKSWRW